MSYRCAPLPPLPAARKAASGLTPHRHDLRSDLERGFDVDLLVQMFEHGAVDFSALLAFRQTIDDGSASRCHPREREAAKRRDAAPHGAESGVHAFPPGRERPCFWHTRARPTRGERERRPRRGDEGS